MLGSWQDNPDRMFEVVVVLAEDAGADPESLGIADYTPVAFQPGMIKAKLTGSELVRLIERPEVDWVGPDDEATIL